MLRMQESTMLVKDTVVRTISRNTWQDRHMKSERVKEEEMGVNQAEDRPEDDGPRKFEEEEKEDGRNLGSAGRLRSCGNVRLYIKIHSFRLIDDDVRMICCFFQHKCV